MRMAALAAAYFALQAAAVAAWWAALALRPGLRPHFQLGAGGEAALLAFAAPDLLVLCAGSAVAAAAVRRGGPLLVPALWGTAGAAVYATLHCLSGALLADAGWWGVVLMAPAGLLSAVFALALTPGATRLFRRAREAPAAWNLAKTAMQITVFWGVLLFVVPALLVALQARIGLPLVEAPAGRAAAAGAFALLSALGLWSGATMALAGRGTPLPVDAPRRLVVRGPYAYVRNPMAVAGLGQGIAVGFFSGSVLVTGYALLGTAIWQCVVRPLEEADLEAAFGSDYVRYRDQVRCWVPRTRPYRAGIALRPAGG